MYAGEVGIEQKWNDLGKTTLFFQYSHNDNGGIDRAVGGAVPVIAGRDIQSSTLEAYGVGIVQALEAADMHLYLTYRHYEGDISTRAAANAPLLTTDLDDLDVVMSGAIIRF
jgi:hypothetical protein